MAVGVARAPAWVRGVAVAAILAALLSGASAQDIPVPPPAPPLAVTLSKACEAPTADVASEAPLARTVQRLRDRTRLKVLTIGASSAMGAGVASLSKRSPSSFEEILERAFQGLDVVMVNRGVSGELAATTAERLKSQVALENPDLVLWQVGANDALSHVPVESFRRSVSDTVGWLKEHNVDVVLVGLQYALAVAKNAYYGEIRDSLRQIAAAQNVLLVRRFEVTAFLEREKTRTATIEDGLDHNDLNYRCLAEHVARAVVVNAFLKK